MCSDMAIKVQNITKHYLIYGKPEDRLKQMIVPRLQSRFFQEKKKYYTQYSAVSNVSFDVKKAQTVGIIGSNGSGKSTLLQMICNTLTPSEGKITVNGRVAALLELGAGFNPEYTGRENVYLNASILGMSRSETQTRFASIEKFADIGIFIDQPVKTYSSGMYVRLAFAVATNVDPDILIVDEALAVGDEAFQRKCFARIEQIKEKGCTILFVSHSAQTIVQLCDRAILLDKGQVLLDGTPKRVISQYQRLINASQEMAPDVRASILSKRDELAASNYQDDLEENMDTSHEEPDIKQAKIEPHKTDCLISPIIQDDDVDTDETQFDTGLISQSVVALEPQGARIHDVKILAANNEQVNILKFGRSYRYQYNVTFDDDASSISFGMLVKSISGLELAGATNETPSYTRIKTATAGTTLKVSFAFTCRLKPGKYFVNAGVVGKIDDDRRHLHRILDAITFRVIEDPNTWDYGYFRMDYKIEAEEI